MSRQEINVFFDPASAGEAQFSFDPDRAVLDGETSAVDVILHTASARGPRARFSKRDGVLWMSDGPPDVEQTVSRGRTVVTLRGFPQDEAQEEVDYGYTVRVEHQGTTYSSTSHYPTMSCVQTGGGG